MHQTDACPLCCTAPHLPLPLDSDEYIALEKFDSRADDELSLSLGDIVTVVSIKLDGWWKIRKGSEVGYAPSAILRKKGMEEIAKVGKPAVAVSCSHTRLLHQLFLCCRLCGTFGLSV